MILRSCAHEAEVRQLLERGHWPQSCPPELRAHAAECRSCGDLILVTQAFCNARSASLNTPQLPPPGVLWWRAQLRRRNAAVEHINKPILGAQIFALSITLTVAAGFMASQAKRSWHWVSSFTAGGKVGFGAGLATRLKEGLADWIASVSQSRAFHFEALVPVASIKAGVSPMYLLPALAVFALLSGVVLYLASDRQ
jgi:hypothetical protein